jgi:hypothetical protein
MWYYGKLSREKLLPKQLSRKKLSPLIIRQKIVAPKIVAQKIVAYGKLSPFYNIGPP